MKHYLILSVLFLIACSDDSEVAGGTRVIGGEEGEKALSRIVVTGDFDSTATAYLYESPYKAIDSTKGVGEVSFSPTGKQSYRVAVRGANKGALTKDLSLGDTMAVKTKEYISSDLKLIAKDSVLEVQAEYSPTITAKGGSFALQLLEPRAEVMLRTEKQTYTYDIAVKEKKATLSPQGEALELELNANLVDESIWQSRYTFSEWAGNSLTIASLLKGDIATLSDTLAVKEEDGKSVLDFNKDAYLSVPLKLKDSAFSMMIAFKTGEDNTGLFQFATSDSKDDFTDWQGYIENGILKVQINSGFKETIEVEKKNYLPNAFNFFILQFDKDKGLTIFVNSKQIGNNIGVKSFGAFTPSYLHIGYSKRSGDIGNSPFLRGNLREISFYSRSLGDSEIRALLNW